MAIYGVMAILAFDVRNERDAFDVASEFTRDLDTSCVAQDSSRLVHTEYVENIWGVSITQGIQMLGLYKKCASKRMI